MNLRAHLSVNPFAASGTGWTDFWGLFEGYPNLTLQDRQPSRVGPEHEDDHVLSGKLTNPLKYLRCRAPSVARARGHARSAQSPNKSGARNTPEA